MLLAAINSVNLVWVETLQRLRFFFPFEQSFLYHVLINVPHLRLQISHFELERIYLIQNTNYFIFCRAYSSYISTAR